ncbi:MAG: nicotinamide riboside transporter PnuC [Rikenellaceae bacterium]
MSTLLSLEVLGALVGILYIILEYRASVWLWPVGVVMPVIYIYIYFVAGIYADMGINVYFLLAAIYGWIVWLRGTHRKASSDEQQRPSEAIQCTTPREWMWCTAAFVATFAALAYTLINFTNSTVPYCDSLTTALSVVGMWMLAHKRIEHWIIWIVVDAISTLLYIEKSLYPTAALYALYTIIAICGYFKWRRMMHMEQEL